MSKKEISFPSSNGKEIERTIKSTNQQLIIRWYSGNILSNNQGMNIVSAFVGFDLF